jgi:hypothetical protein
MQTSQQLRIAPHMDLLSCKLPDSIKLLQQVSAGDIHLLHGHRLLRWTKPALQVSQQYIVASYTAM